MLTNKGRRELQAEASRLGAEAREIFDRAEKAVRDMTAAEAAAFDARITRVDAIRAQLAEDSDLNVSDEHRDIFARVAGSAAGQLPGGGTTLMDQVLKPTDIDMAVCAWVRNAHGERIPPEEYEAAYRCGAHPAGAATSVTLPVCRPMPGAQLTFQPRNDLSRPLPGKGGVLIGSGGFMGQLEHALKAHSAMMMVSQVMVTDHGRPMGWPTLDDTANEGVQIGENQESSDSDLDFRAQMFAAYKFGSGVIKASHELVRDSAVGLAGEIGKALGTRLGRIINKRATIGTGAATITGVVNRATVGHETASNTAIAFDELIELQGSLEPSYREVNGRNIRWMMHNDTATLVRRLKDGQGRYLWQESNEEGQPATLLGDPVSINNHMPTVAPGVRPILYGDFNHYKLRIVNAIRFRQLTERYAEKDQIGFLSFLEADGNLLSPSADEDLCPIRALKMAD